MRLLVLLLYAVSVVNGVLGQQVGLRYRGNLICQGSIINRRHILTAAHCIYRLDPKLFEVVDGTVYHNADIYLAESLLWPINYDEIKIVNDIGLIRLTKNITEINFQPVILPSSYYVPEGETAVIKGWVRWKTTEGSSVYFTTSGARVISQSLCEQHYSQLSKNNICAYKTIIHHDYNCFDDSGGPLVLNGIQIGIVSIMGCSSHSPDVYTRVYPYMKWIQIMSESTDNECTEINATNLINLNIWIVLSLTILTLVSYSNLLS